MSTYKELVYLVLDELKLISDDSTFTEDHVLFLLGKYRSFLLKQRYSDIKKQIPDSNYQSIIVNLEKATFVNDDPASEAYLRSVKQVPITMQIGAPKVTPINYYNGEINLISRERMRYVGYNRFLSNMIYCSVGPDQYLYFKPSGTSTPELSTVRYTGIFEDIYQAATMEFNNTGPVDIMDMNFPIEESLISPLVDLILKELSGPSWKPEDDSNDASDNLANLANFIARNTKNNVQKQIEE